MATEQAQYREESRGYYSADNRLMVYQVNRDIKNQSNTNWGAYEVYWYDALGRRVFKRSYQAGGLCNRSGYCLSTYERFGWDGDQVLWESRSGFADTVNVVQNSDYGYVGYTHALGIDAPVGMIRNREVVVLHQNWRGKYAWSTDEDGNGTACAAGGACGARYPWPGAAPFSYGLNPDFGRTHIWYGSLAKDQYDQSGLQYRRNRYYDPMLGQFTQDDPIGVAGGLNTYGYAAGDPVNFSDPFGLCPEDRQDAGGLCPGGLTVDEWDLVLAAAEVLREEAGTRLIKLLEAGRVRPGVLPSNVMMRTGFMFNPRWIVTNTRARIPSSLTLTSVFEFSPGDLGWLFAHELGHHRQTPPIGAPLVQYVRRMFGFNSEADANAYACSVTTHRSGLAGEMCR